MNKLFTVLSIFFLLMVVAEVDASNLEFNQTTYDQQSERMKPIYQMATRGMEVTLRNGKTVHIDHSLVGLTREELFSTLGKPNSCDSGGAGYYTTNPQFPVVAFRGFESADKVRFVMFVVNPDLEIRKVNKREIQCLFGKGVSEGKKVTYEDDGKIVGLNWHWLEMDRLSGITFGSTSTHDGFRLGSCQDGILSLLRSLR